MGPAKGQYVLVQKFISQILSFSFNTTLSSKMHFGSPVSLFQSRNIWISEQLNSNLYRTFKLQLTAKLKVMPNSVVSATCSPSRMKWYFRDSVKSVF